MKTVLAIHGFAGGTSSFEHLRAELDPSIRLVVHELGGHGLEPREALSLEDEADRVSALLDELEGRVVLLGYSLGGRVALHLVGDARIDAAMIVSAHLGLLSEEERETRLADDCRLAASLRADGLEVFFEAWEALPLFASQRALPEAVRSVRATERRAHNPRALAYALERFSLGLMRDTRPLVAEAAHPLVFVAGALDSKFTALATEAAALARDGRLVVVDGVGHDVGLEAPAIVAANLRSIFGELG